MGVGRPRRSGIWAPWSGGIGLGGCPEDTPHGECTHPVLTFYSTKEYGWAIIARGKLRCSLGSYI